MHIAIAGNIGAGKTTLTRMLAQRYGWQPYYEDVADNPYLSDFYTDMARWAFNLQVFFLTRRFAEVVAIGRAAATVVQDRTIFEDANIFARNLHQQGYMSERDYANYRELFDLMISLVRLPDLMIYIRSSIPTLIAQIGRRGRAYEQSIRLDYLQGLNALYEEWISTYEGRLIIVDGDTTKFESNSGAFQQITDRIDSALYGLFPFETTTNS